MKTNDRIQNSQTGKQVREKPTLYIQQSPWGLTRLDAEDML